MEYNILPDLNIRSYHENINSNLNIAEEAGSIGDDIYFYPDENGNIITLTKKYRSIVPKDHSIQRVFDRKKAKEVDYVSTFFLGSVAVIGLFVLFQLNKRR